jgi:hypothetical protein
MNGIALAAALTAAAVPVFLAPSTASATVRATGVNVSDGELDTAMAGTPPTFTSGECVSYTGAKACFPLCQPSVRRPASAG